MSAVAGTLYAPHMTLLEDVEASFTMASCPTTAR